MLAYPVPPPPHRFSLPPPGYGFPVPPPWYEYSLPLPSLPGPLRLSQLIAYLFLNSSPGSSSILSVERSRMSS